MPCRHRFRRSSVCSHITSSTSRPPPANPSPSSFPPPSPLSRGTTARQHPAASIVPHSTRQCTGRLPYSGLADTACQPTADSSSTHRCSIVLALRTWDSLRQSPTNQCSLDSREYRTTLLDLLAGRSVTKVGTEARLQQPFHLPLISIVHRKNTDPNRS